MESKVKSKTPAFVNWREISIFLFSAICSALFVYTIFFNLLQKSADFSSRDKGHIAFPDLQQKEEPLIADFKFTDYVSGKKNFTVNAEKFYLRNKKVNPLGFRIAAGKSVEMEKVGMVFYKDGSPVSRITSKYASMDMKNKNIIFEGHPALITEDKRILAAEKIVWDNNKKSLYAQDRCVLGAGGKRYLADRIDSDVELKNFSIDGKSDKRRN